MLQGADHDRAKVYMQSVMQAHSGDAGKVAFADLGTQDVTKSTGCDEHPNIAQHQRMADLLVAAIQAKLGW